MGPLRPIAAFVLILAAPIIVVWLFPYGVAFLGWAMPAFINQVVPGFVGFVRNYPYVSAVIFLVILFRRHLWKPKRQFDRDEW